ncbi:MAG: phosphoserine aminotransferase [Saprospiraceae bacterium]|jgi:phosphoserine aminotransferase
MKTYNFSAGPAILPEEVFQEAAEAVRSFTDKGLSILEISHRSKEFQAVMDEAMALAKELLSIPDTHEVLFLQGGASSQFLTVAINLLGSEETAGYIDTGSWSSKAIKEAKLYGKVNTLASSKDDNYTSIPKGYDIPNDLKYLHITSNNTIFGTQFQSFPETVVPIVADMSSDIFSRPIDVSKYGVIYAGAQKNMGPAGTTVVIVNKDLVKNNVRQVPTILDYNTHVAKQSMFNTPPTFAIYVSMLTLRWVKKQGGVTAMQEKNEQKAQLLYGTIDNSKMFSCPVAPEDRSRMNAVFLINDDSHNEAFLAAATAAGCDAIKGHRSVGGFRASIYNAMPLAGVQTLVDVIQKFDQANG